MAFTGIFIPNEIFYGQSNERLNVEELFLWFFFHKEKDLDNYTYITNLKLLNELVIFLEDSKDNKKRIIQHLQSLSNKEYIKMNVESIEEIRRKNLTIKLPREYKKNLGFTRVLVRFFGWSESPLQFALLVFIKMNEFKTNTFSNKELRTYMLNFKNNSISKNTIIQAHDDLENRGVLTIIRGIWVVKLDGKYRQKENGFIINSEAEVREAENEAFTTEINDKLDGYFGNDKKEGKQKQKAVDYLQKLPTKLDLKHYLAIKTHSNQYVTEFAQDRFDKMEAGGFDFSRWDKELERELDRNKRQKKLNEQWEKENQERRVEPAKKFPMGKGWGRLDDDDEEYDEEYDEE